MREQPGRGVKLMSLSMYAIVRKVSESVVDMAGSPARFFEVIYVQSTLETARGWVYAGYLEPYVETFKAGLVGVQNPTPNPNDAAQYLITHGKVQYNLCGFFCVCYCAEWDVFVEVFIDYLQTKTKSLIERVFPSWNGRGTSDYDLEVMLGALGYPVPLERIGAALFDKTISRTMLTAGRMAHILERNRVIYSVRINKRNGRLAKSGVLHWVTLEEVRVDEFGGIVKLYNPFNNKMEIYAWEQLVESGGVPYGVIVPRFDI